MRSSANDNDDCDGNCTTTNGDHASGATSEV